MTPSRNAKEPMVAPILALDAMGVLYSAADDVADLLIPFAARKGSIANSHDIESAYLDASLGLIAAAAFWRRIGLDPGLEDEYLAGHQLVDGVMEFLAAAAPVFAQVCCISNDVSSWSAKLRHSFRIERIISPWLISGDIGVRKPDPGIYQKAIARLQVPARRIIFVDDRVKNLDAARQLGIKTVLFDPGNVAKGSDHVRIRRLIDLIDLAKAETGAGQG